MTQYYRQAASVWRHALIRCPLWSLHRTSPGQFNFASCRFNVPLHLLSRKRHNVSAIKERDADEVRKTTNTRKEFRNHAYSIGVHYSIFVYRHGFSQIVNFNFKWSPCRTYSGVGWTVLLNPPSVPSIWSSGCPLPWLKEIPVGPTYFQLWMQWYSPRRRPV
jgi:hypothetical protein